MIAAQPKPFTFPSSVFFIGIGGIEVSALAKLALSEGARVAGTDLAESDITKELQKREAAVVITKNQGSIQLTRYKTQLVVYSLAVKDAHPLREQAQKMRIQTLGTHQVLGEISKTRFTIAISGMHGKSTTTSMIGIMLESAGLNPLVIVGTKVPQWRGNIRIPKVTRYSLPVTRYFVLEADEYRSKMLALHPDIIVLTRIEEDHLDYYKNLAHIKREFRKYVRRLREKGIVVANWGDGNIREIGKLPARRIGRGNWKLVKYNYRDQKIAEKLRKILKVPGKHNIENALAAYHVGKHLGLSDAQILTGLSKFKGTWRRLELAGKFQMSNVKCQIPIISDYAHHPTEIRASLQALREKYPKKRLVLAYQPHQHNRTKMLFNQFVESFDEADALILNEIFDVAGREEKGDQDVSSEQLAAEIQKRHEWREKPIYYSPNLQKTKQKIKALAHKNDVLIIMGAGDIDSLARELVSSAPVLSPWKTKQRNSMLTIRHDIPLASFTTLKIGGPADYFIEAQNEEKIIEALKWANEHKVPFYILSGGSNVLISDQGFRGLIIRIKNQELRIKRGRVGGVVTAAAGVSLPLLAKKTAEAGLSGLEFGIGVPGTVGGAVYGNAGAFGQETRNVLQSVRVLMPEKKIKIEELSKNTCKFSYRDSIFKRHKNWVILSAVFTLKKDTKERCEKRMMEMLKDKTTHQPMGKQAAGSIFKNPPGDHAWRLIDEVGMRGRTVGDAHVSEQHANYLINKGHATAKDFVRLIAMVKKQVHEKCGVLLEEEIQYVGF